MTNQLAFGLGIAPRDTPDLLHQCLHSLRTAYPTARIYAVFDGEHEHVTPAALHTSFRVQAFEGRNMKMGLKNGAVWWHRFLTFMLCDPADYIVKIDTDTLVHRPLSLAPLGKRVCAGTIMSPGEPWQHVQGGFQMMDRDFARRAMHEASKVKYQNPESWRTGDAHYFIDRNEVSLDYTLRAITQNIRGTMIAHPESDCVTIRSHHAPVRSDCAVSHPHKL